MGLLYDLGDDHRFGIRAKDISAKANPRASYPRLLAEKGRSPRQQRDR